jgi:hypothetical protein
MQRIPHRIGLRLLRKLLAGCPRTHGAPDGPPLHLISLLLSSGIDCAGNDSRRGWPGLHPAGYARNHGQLLFERHVQSADPALWLP